MRAQILVMLVALCGCDVIFPLEPPAPPCAIDDDCDGGRCECGACSSPDVTCMTTNRRWIAGSPGALDGTCVPAVEQIDARVNHTCATTTDGSAWCWGSNAAGQLGPAQPMGTASTLPILMTDGGGKPLTGVVEIGTGAGSTCARRLDGSILCWGENMFGQLGAGLTEGLSVEPVLVRDETGAPLEGARSLTVGFFHACAIIEPGSLVCWGLNGKGQIGDGSTTDRPTAVPSMVPAGNLQAVSAGGEHTCALVDNFALCWGRPSNGRLGNGMTNDDPSPIPTFVAGLDSINKIAAGNRHTCAIKIPPNEVFCWGANAMGAVGNGTTMDVPIALKILVPDGEKSLIATDDLHTCATTNNDLYCWGADSNGELGDGPDDDQPELSPTQVANDRLQDLTTGFRTTCALGSDRALRCWGANDAGQLGVGDLDNRDVPTEISAAAFCPVP
jgi:alpha-tubulin suppressor-like RCC1 family protein